MACINPNGLLFPNRPVKLNLQRVKRFSIFAPTIILVWPTMPILLKLASGLSIAMGTAWLRCVLSAAHKKNTNSWKEKFRASSRWKTRSFILPVLTPIRACLKPCLARKTPSFPMRSITLRLLMVSDSARLSVTVMKTTIWRLWKQNCKRPVMPVQTYCYGWCFFHGRDYRESVRYL